MNQTKIVVYGTQWCGDCHAATKFLDQHQVSYEWIDISNNFQAQKYVKHVNNGMQRVPTISRTVLHSDNVLRILFN